MDIFTILGKNYDSNIYVVTGNVPTLIDTGTGIYSRDVIKKINKFIKPSSLEQIILTHEHYDHVGGAIDVLKSTEGKAKISAHKNATERLVSGESSFAQLLGGIMPKIHIDTAFIGGERIVLGDETFEVLHTPGHSQGSICLYGKKSKSLFSGDTVFANGDFGRYDLPGGNLQSLSHSIKQLSTLDIQDLYPGHGPIIKEYAKEHVLKSYQIIQSLM
jgi:glyoxylase-like metal-dependent hydrolase (beta-lactamase superfamily II)